MALETATYVSDLVTTNPTDSDGDVPGRGAYPAHQVGPPEYPERHHGHPGADQCDRHGAGQQRLHGPRWVHNLTSKLPSAASTWETSGNFAA
jgi:hypothetical protein